jgi:hypothetical protein
MKKEEMNGLLTKKDYKDLVETIFQLVEIEDKFQVYQEASTLIKQYLDVTIWSREDDNKHVNNNVIIVLLESGPEKKENFYLYNWDELFSSSDSYLRNICVGFGVQFDFTITKKKALLELWQAEKVLVLDLFPFHGIAISTENRKVIANHINEQRTKVLLKDINKILKSIKGPKKFLFGVPQTIWNLCGGFGSGSLYAEKEKNGPLGCFSNSRNVMNVGGRGINSKAITKWHEMENT